MDHQLVMRLIDFCSTLVIATTLATYTWPAAIWFLLKCSLCDCTWILPTNNTTKNKKYNTIPKTGIVILQYQCATISIYVAHSTALPLRDKAKLINWQLIVRPVFGEIIFFIRNFQVLNESDIKSLSFHYLVIDYKLAV